MRTFDKGAFSSIAANDRACWKKKKTTLFNIILFSCSIIRWCHWIKHSDKRWRSWPYHAEHRNSRAYDYEQIWEVSAATFPAPNPMSEKKTAVKWRSRSSFTSRHSSLPQQSGIYLELVWVDDWWLCWTLMPATNKAASGGSDDSWWQRTTDILFNLSACGGQTHCHTQ